jgi:L-fuculose-phosphate aldolase
MEAVMELRAKQYFDERATQEMKENLKPQDRTLQERLAYACRILAMTGQEAGLAGQITARSDKPKCYWTLRFGLGFDEATPDDFIEVDADLNTISGKGMANPATRFHLWVYEARPQTNAIIHTHSPYVSALVAARQPLVIAQMDMTPLHNDCAFLADCILLAHHGQLTTGAYVEEATYLAVYLERAARMQVRARVFGPITPVPDDLAAEAHDYLLKQSIVKGTFDYWCRQADRV